MSVGRSRDRYPCGGEACATRPASVVMVASSAATEVATIALCTSSDDPDRATAWAGVETGVCSARQQLVNAAPGHGAFVLQHDARPAPLESGTANADTTSVNPTRTATSRFESLGIYG